LKIEVGSLKRTFDKSGGDAGIGGIFLPTKGSLWAAPSFEVDTTTPTSFPSLIPRSAVLEFFAFLFRRRESEGAPVVMGTRSPEERSIFGKGEGDAIWKIQI
jgi:hypothetical protein